MNVCMSVPGWLSSSLRQSRTPSLENEDTHIQGLLTSTQLRKSLRDPPISQPEIDSPSQSLSFHNNSTLHQVDNLNYPSVCIPRKLEQNPMNQRKWSCLLNKTVIVLVGERCAFTFQCLKNSGLRVWCRFSVVQVALELTAQLKMSLNSWSTCLHLSRPGIAELHSFPPFLRIHSTSGVSAS